MYEVKVAVVLEPHQGTAAVTRTHGARTEACWAELVAPIAEHVAGRKSMRRLRRCVMCHRCRQAARCL